MCLICNIRKSTNNDFYMKAYGGCKEMSLENVTSWWETGSQPLSLPRSCFWVSSSLPHHPVAPHSAPNSWCRLRLVGMPLLPPGFSCLSSTTYEPPCVCPPSSVPAPSHSSAPVFLKSSSPAFPPYHSNGQPLAFCPPLLTERLSPP